MENNKPSEPAKLRLFNVRSINRSMTIRKFSPIQLRSG